MKKSILFFLILIHAMVSSARSFDSEVKALTESIVATVEKDPRTLDSCMNVLEARISGYEGKEMNVTNATELSVLHAVAGWLYRQITDPFADYRNADVDYEAKCREHWSHVLDHKTQLSKADARKYKVLVKLGADGILFDHDMLIVMAELYASHHDRYAWDRKGLYHELKTLYESEGKISAAGVLDDILTYKAVADTIFENKDSAIVFWRECQRKYAGSRYLKSYKSKENKILNPYFKVETKNGVRFLPGKPTMINYEYWNCKSARLTICRYNGKISDHGYEDHVRKSIGEVVQDIDISFGYDEKNKEREARNLPVAGKGSIAVTLPEGLYVFIMQSPSLKSENGDGKKSYNIVNVTSLRIATVIEAGKIHCYVVNTITGKPVKGANVLFEETYFGAEKHTLTTDVNGEAVLPVSGDYQSYRITALLSGNDRVEMYVNTSYRGGHNTSKEALRSRIFLDRKIYRPGQTVKGSFVLFQETSKDVFEVVGNKNVHIECRNNGRDSKVMYQDTVLTNSMGSREFSFVIPKDADLGNYTVSVNNQTCIFKVEEYKRPTWEMSLKPVSDTLAVELGDTVVIEGTARAYSGVPVQGGKVSYTIKRQYFEDRDWWYYNEPDEVIGRDTITVGDDGRFLIPLPLSADSDQDTDYVCVLFKVNAKVTDSAGETHEDSYSVRVLKEGISADINIGSGDIIDLSNEGQLRVSVVDAFRNEVDADVECTLFLKDKALCKKVIPANKPFLISELHGYPDLMPMGSYRFAYSVRNRYGKEVGDTTGLISVFDSDIRKIGIRSTDFAKDFFYAPDDTIAIGKTQKIYFCPASADATVFYFQECNDTITHRSIDVYDNRMNILTVQSPQKGHDGTQVLLFYVKDGIVYSHNKTFYTECPDETLALSWSTFRDRLEPGQKETWKLKVSDKDGKPAGSAELFATMYDASLDAFAPNSWSFERLAHRYVQWLRLGTNHRTYNIFARFSHSVDFTGCGYTFDKFVMLQNLNPHRLVVGRMPLRLRGVSTLQRVSSGLDEVSAEEALQGRIAGLDVKSSNAKVRKNTVLYAAAPDMQMEAAVGIVPLNEVEEVIEKEPSVTPRTNFAETAFFYPHLMTDDNGEVEISFTLPESLTEWKFLGFAHDRKMKNGIITAKATARKQFMVQPQMPRFIRVGDNATIATRIINQSEKAITGKATMRLLHAKDESLITSQTLTFSVEAGKTTNVSFPLTATTSDDDIICEIVAVGSEGINGSRVQKGKGSKANGTYSDGERNLIPVLPSRLVITESVPFFIKGGEEKTVNLSGLYNGGSQTAGEKTMSIEYTANPVWTVVEALRDIRTPESPSATSIAASIYANTKLLSITSQLKSHTDKQVINQDTISAKLAKSWKDLKALQRNDGGFTWFPGFSHSSYYITLSVAEQLIKLGDAQEDNSSAHISEATYMNYLDSIQIENYEERKKYNIRTIPSESDLHYLYVCSQCPERKVSAKVRKIREEYLTYLEKNAKELSIYGMSVSSNILRAFGHKSSAEKLVNNVRAYLVYDEGQGKHFESRRALYSWRDYRIPTQVAAMNAIHAANPADDNLNDMTLWLLRQKQVQSWDTPVNTVDVADLILKLNQLGTAPNQDGVSLSIKEKRVFSLNGTRLTDKSFIRDNMKKDSLMFADEMGIMNKQVDPALINAKKDMSLTISPSRANQQDGSFFKTKDMSYSWGAVTVTFTEDSENLKSYTTGEISISRRIMVEKDGKWTDMDKDATLTVGQKIRVRHTLSTDRDMDYICVKTLHPACFEPSDQLSGYRWKGGAGCYQSIHDSYVEMFFERFREGTSTLDIDYYVTRPGTYNMGITTATCTYAPSFGGHSGAMKVRVNE